MVTWRGKTDVERGFAEFCKGARVDADWIWQDAAQSPQRLSEIAADIERVKPDLVYTWGTPATLGIAGSAAKPHPVIGKTIPLVFALVADPVAAGITLSRLDHGRNLTGVSHVAPLETQLESMRAYRPVKGVGVFYNRAEPNSVSIVERWNVFGKSGGFPVVAVPFPSAGNATQPQPFALDAIATHLAQMRTQGVNWLYLGPDSFLFTQLPLIAGTATRAGLPTFAAVESIIAGPAPVLVGLVSEFYQIGQFAAYKAMRILSGQRNLPIETLKRFSLIVRLDTAREIGIYPPLAMVDYADFRGQKKASGVIR
jgi:putative ABC transport system substrate-binding protein